MVSKDVLVRICLEPASWYLPRLSALSDQIAVTTDPVRPKNGQRAVLIAFQPPQDDDLSGYDWIHSGGAGVDKILQTLGDHPVPPITRTTGQMGRQIGEYCLSYALAWLQKHPLRERLAAERRWSPLDASPQVLFGTDVAIIGTGAIGQGIAKVFGPLAQSVSGLSLSGQERPDFDKILPFRRHREISAQIVIAALPFTKETKNLISDGFFQNLSDAQFINVGRGATTDHAALRRAFDRGQLDQAVLDVFAEEPLPQDDWAWHHPQCVVTPHISGITQPEDTVAAFAEQLPLFLAGRPLKNPIDPARGY